MKTLSYINGFEEIMIGSKYYFGQLWDGNGDGLELLQSGVIAVWDDEIDDYKMVKFDIEDDIVEEMEDDEILKIIVRVIDIY